jgi:hypothetical protein
VKTLQKLNIELKIDDAMDKIKELLISYINGGYGYGFESQVDTNVISEPMLIESNVISEPMLIESNVISEPISDNEPSLIDNSVLTGVMVSGSTIIVVYNYNITLTQHRFSLLLPVATMNANCPIERMLDDEVILYYTRSSIIIEEC